MVPAQKRSLKPTNRGSQHFYARLVFVLGSILIAAWLASQIQPIVQAVILAILTAYFIDPVNAWAARKTGWRHENAARFTFVLFWLVMIAVLLLAGPLIIRKIWPWASAELFAARDVALSYFSRSYDLFGYQFSTAYFWDNLDRIIQGGINGLSGNFGALASGLTLSLLQGFTFLVSLYYFLLDGYRIKPAIINLIPSGSRDELTHLIDEIDLIWRAFLRVQVLIFVILTILLILGMAVVIGLNRLGLISLSPVGFIIGFVLIFTAVQQVDNLWLRPRLMSRHLQLHPGLAFAALTGALALGSLVGALFIIPTIATVQLTGGYIYRKLNDLPAWETEDFTAAGNGGENKDGEMSGKGDVNTGLLR